MKKGTKIFVTTGLTVALLVATISVAHITNEVMKFEQHRIDTLGRADKIKEVETYMEFALKNQGFSRSATGLKAETLVDVSIEKGFDLPFLVAAAHQESCFGATRRARKTNSVYSVGAYDSGVNTITYKDPNDSVEAYVDLLNRRYLIGGKTIHDLMKPGAFVNNVGNRYASDSNYEYKIRKLRNMVIKRCPSLT